MGVLSKDEEQLIPESTFGSDKNTLQILVSLATGIVWHCN